MAISKLALILMSVSSEGSHSCSQFKIFACEDPATTRVAQKPTWQRPYLVTIALGLQKEREQRIAAKKQQLREERDLRRKHEYTKRCAAQLQERREKVSCAACTRPDECSDEGPEGQIVHRHKRASLSALFLPQSYTCSPVGILGHQSPSLKTLSLCCLALLGLSWVSKLFIPNRSDHPCRVSALSSCHWLAV